MIGIFPHCFYSVSNCRASNYTVTSSNSYLSGNLGQLSKFRYSTRPFFGGQGRKGIFELSIKSTFLHFILKIHLLVLTPEFTPNRFGSGSASGYLRESFSLSYRGISPIFPEFIFLLCDGHLGHIVLEGGQ